SIVRHGSLLWCTPLARESVIAERALPRTGHQATGPLQEGCRGTGSRAHGRQPEQSACTHGVACRGLLLPHTTRYRRSIGTFVRATSLGWAGVHAHHERRCVPASAPSSGRALGRASTWESTVGGVDCGVRARNVVITTTPATMTPAAARVSGVSCSPLKTTPKSTATIGLT